MSSSLVKVLLSVVLLTSFGWLRIPSENRLCAAQRAEKLRAPASTLSLGEQLSQGIYTTVLGGFRGVMASWMNIQSMVDFNREDWAALNQRYRIITRLQPQIEEYWFTWGHHMAYNAASYYDRNTAELPTVLARQKSAESVDVGIGIFREGIRTISESWQLPMRLGDTLNGRNGRKKDPRASAAAYEVSWDRYVASGAKANRYFILRNVAYQLALLNDADSQLKAFHILKERFNQGDRQPSLLRDLRELQKKPSIPAAERFPVPEDYAPPGPADLLTPEGAKRSLGV